MGVILAKFRKSKTTYEILEKLENDLKGIEAYTRNTQERQKRIVGNLILFSIGLYAIGLIVIYFYFFPTKWAEIMIYLIPILLFPILILFLKRMVAWYFQRKLNKNSDKLNTLKAEKKKIIERVMEQETYKVALEIINRFGEPTRPSLGGFAGYNTHTSPKPQSTALTPLPQSTQRQLSYNQQQQTGGISIGRPIITTSTATPQRQNSQLGFSSMQYAQAAGLVTPQIMSSTPTSGSFNRFNQTPQLSQYQRLQQQQQQQLNVQRTPFPIINQNQKSIFEKMVDFLIGDGPNNLYGMVCKECHAHNGMTSFEDFQYTAFTCAFCSKLNPARKLRPVGPRLPDEFIALNATNSDNVVPGNSTGQPGSQLQSDQPLIHDTSSSERDSDSDSESSDNSHDLNVARNSNTATTEANNINDAYSQSAENLMQSSAADVPENTDRLVEQEILNDETLEAKADDEKKND